MSGAELRTKLQKTGISISEIGRRIGMSSQAMNQAFSVKDVKSSLLERIAEVIGEEMTFFYPSKTTISTTNNISRQHAHNISNGSGDITEATGNDGIVKSLLEQNAALIELLKKNQ